MLANLQLEPTRPMVCAIMSLRRAAQLDRYAAPMVAIAQERKYAFRPL